MGPAGRSRGLSEEAAESAWTTGPSCLLSQGLAENAGVGV